MDFRQYDNAIGRFHGMDRLAELAPGITPYRFGFNNPNFWSDPTGLFETESAANAHIEQFGLTGATVWYNQSRGYWEISTGGYSFWQNGRGTFMVSYIAADGVVFVNTGEGAISPGQQSSPHSIGLNNYINYGMQGLISATGASSGINVYQSGYLIRNELWHKTKTRGYSFAWQGKWKTGMAKAWRAEQVGQYQEARRLGSKFTKAGGVLMGADIIMSGELKPSHGINALMLGISGTGIGSIIAATWFIADYGTMGVNYLMGNGATGLGEMLDKSIGTYEMYDGLY